MAVMAGVLMQLRTISSYFDKATDVLTPPWSFALPFGHDLQACFDSLVTDASQPKSAHERN